MNSFQLPIKRLIYRCSESYLEAWFILLESLACGTPVMATRRRNADVLTPLQPTLVTETQKHCDRGSFNCFSHRRASLAPIVKRVVSMLCKIMTGRSTPKVRDVLLLPLSHSLSHALKPDRESQI
jgi:hypothetical protein